MATTDTVARAGSTVSEVDEKKKVDVHQEEVAVAKLTEDDLFRISKEALSFKGKTAFKITLIMLTMGCNQAGECTASLGEANPEAVLCVHLLTLNTNKYCNRIWC